MPPSPPSVCLTRQALGAQSLLPVTLAQITRAIQTATDGAVMVGDKDMKHSYVRFVGRIVAMEEVNANQIVFALQDGTQKLSAAWFIDSDENDFITSRRSAWQYVWGALVNASACAFPCRPPPPYRHQPHITLASPAAFRCRRVHRIGQYVSVVGQVKAFGEDIQTQAFDVRPITDFDEVTHHFLEAIYCHLYMTKGPLDMPVTAPGASLYRYCARRPACLPACWSHPRDDPTPTGIMMFPRHRGR